MNPIHAAATAALLATLAPAQQPAPDQAAPRPATPPQALTIYNQDFAVVRDRVPLDLAQGTNEVRFVGVTRQLEPDSVVLRDPNGRVDLAVLEQSYRADAVSQGLLLQHFEGQVIDFLVRGADGEERFVRGRIVRSGYTPGAPQGGETPIVEVDGRLRFSLPGLPLFPALGDDSILVPTLNWRLHASEPAQLDAEVSYVTGGMSWQASYNLIAPEHGDTMDVVGWITLDNRSGKTFRDASIKLMAGDVNKLAPEGAVTGSDEFYLGLARKAGAPQVTEKAFDEFHLYSLPLPTTLRDREQKQVEFVRATGVRTNTLYVYDGAALGQYRGWDRMSIRQQPDYGTQSNEKVWVMREFANTEANGLGLPLPKGRTRFYRRDSADGRLEFTGENVIDHTPRDETLRIYTGDAFDVVGERKRTDYRLQNGDKQLEEAFEIRVRNHKQSAVTVRVVEHMYRWVNWQVIQKSHEFVRTDDRTVEFRIDVPADGEVVVTYRVRYDWQ